MKIFKKDSKGRIRSLEIYAHEDQIIQKAGLLEGAKTTHYSTCKAKNVGRANATTAKEQAVKDLEFLNYRENQEFNVLIN